MAKASFPAGLGIPMLGARESEREYQNIPVAVNRKMAKTKNSLSKCLFKGSSRDDLSSSDNSRVLPSQEKGRDAVEYVYFASLSSKTGVSRLTIRSSVA